MADVEAKEVVASAIAAEAAAPAEKKARAPKVTTKEKKPKGSKSSAPAHPPYFQVKTKKIQSFWDFCRRFDSYCRERSIFFSGVLGF